MFFYFVLFHRAVAYYFPACSRNISSVRSRLCTFALTLRQLTHYNCHIHLCYYRHTFSLGFLYNFMSYKNSLELVAPVILKICFVMVLIPFKEGEQWNVLGYHIYELVY